MIKSYELAKAFIKDVEFFYKISSLMRVKVEYYAKMRGHASIAGSDERSIIKLSKDYCDHEIETIDDALFSLIILSHEVSHYLHNHNAHKDICELDIKAIEMWADFFSSRIIFCVITHGKNTQKIFRKLDKSINQTIILEAFGRALLKVSNYIYSQNTDERYPSTEDRLHSIIAGIQSFFIRHFRKINPEFQIHVFTRVAINSGITKILQKSTTKENDIERITNHTAQIHKKIQSVRLAITHGVKEKYSHLLDTNFQITDEQIENNKKYFKEAYSSKEYQQAIGIA